MREKLHITVMMNTPMEDVFAFKCISAQDMNLEIRVRNDGDTAVIMQSRCVFENDREKIEVDYLYPSGVQIVGPGDAVAFYCFMDESRFATFDRIALYDEKGRAYTKNLRD